MRQLVKQRPKSISLNRICKRLQLTRSTFYYKSTGESDLNIKIMEFIDKQYLAHPTTGVVMMTSMLNHNGFQVNVKRVRRLMRKMNLMPIYPQKCLSTKGETNYVKPYLLRGMNYTHSNQVWSTDISYIPMRHGFMYLYAVIDVYSRYIVGWKLSNTLHASNCIDLIQDCVDKQGKPEIINSDQGVQYTSCAWTNLLSSYGIKISMDGRGRCKDNIWIERFWRTIKQEQIYINPADDGKELYDEIKEYIMYYNTQRPHQGIAKSLPCFLYKKAA